MPAPGESCQGIWCRVPRLVARDALRVRWPEPDPAKAMQPSPWRVSPPEFVEHMVSLVSFTYGCKCKPARIGHAEARSKKGFPGGVRPVVWGKGTCGGLEDALRGLVRRTR